MIFHGRPGRGKEENIGDNEEVLQGGGVVLSAFAEAGLSAQELVEKKAFTRTPDSLRVPEEEILESGVQEQKLNLMGSSEVVHIKIRDDGSAVFKPRDGEVDFSRGFGHKQGTLYLRERAAYLVDRFLGFNLVPPTTIREVDGRVGSVQQFIPDTQELCEISHTDCAAHDSDFGRLMLFDYLVWNADRNERNLLVSKTPEGKRSIHAIDNSLTFDGQASLYSVKNSLGEPVPSDIAQNIQKIIQDEGMKALLKELLLELLPKKDVMAFFARMEMLAQDLSGHKEDSNHIPPPYIFRNYNPGGSR
jgi:hypothetical protein